MNKDGDGFQINSDGNEISYNTSKNNWADGFAVRRRNRNTVKASLANENRVI